MFDDYRFGTIMSIEEAISKIDNYYNKNEWDWKDYSDAIKIFFKISHDVGIDKLTELNEINKYYRCLSIALNTAGENGEVGYDFKGIKTIQEYAKYLDYYTLECILKNFEVNRNGMFRHSLRSKVRRALIESSTISDEERKLLKFRYFDMYYFARAALKSFNSILTDRYSDYEFITVEELNKELNQNNVNEKIFWKALKKGDRILYEKIDITSSQFFISLTPNSDINNMSDYLDDLYVMYYDNKIELIINKIDGKETKKKICFNFDENIWDIEKMEDSEYGEQTALFLDSCFKEYYIKFDLVYLYAKNIHGQFEREVVFQDVFDIEIGERISITEKEKDNYSEMPVDFFGKNINNVMAVIGKNGSGKSSVFRMILENPLFSQYSNESYVKKWGDYLLIYKLNDKYYYTCSNNIEILDNSKKIITKLDDHIAVNLCLISNTMDIMDIKNENNKGYVLPSGVLSGMVDLTTNTFLRTFSCSLRNKVVHGQTIIPNEDPVQFFQIQEKNRIRNLENFLNKEQNIKLKKELDLKEFDEKFNFSSGEYARWSLFARIFSIFYREDSSRSNLPEITPAYSYFLFLDEAELYMHPAWQRRLIHDILKLLTMINVDKRYFSNMTIIFSSNSPFLMSDIPDDRVHLFDSETSEHIKTFGQNIYNLLKNNFFMPEGGIGEFAKSKIKEAFEELNEKNNDIDNPLKIAKYVNDIIGEDVYRYYLSEKLDEIR